MKPIVLIKLGGLPASNDVVLRNLLKDMSQATGLYDFILVHGGGKEVTQLSELMGLQTTFDNGIRITSPQEMRAVDMVLSGRVNTHMVRQALAAGFKPVGLGGQDGGLIEASPIQSSAYPQTRTAKVDNVQPGLLELLLEKGYLPILHSTASDKNGMGLNINADDVALAVAVAVKANRLLYISDVAGVRSGDTWLRYIDGETADRLIKVGVITGGMIPKIKSSLDAVRRGVGGVIIGDYLNQGDLKALLQGVKGTVIK